ncbi:hypothetical protein OUZ56_015629 [Daphnia magna]|uniref:Uncharacterized protein n=1 Tax=Daphnia magna TaxID=35525 RepID=A0ABR0ANG2_9CRUS|nr:hypothetical protein OUZ56_015629 [Daphnia magna]
MTLTPNYTRLAAGNGLDENTFTMDGRLGQLVIERQNVVADIGQHRPQTSNTPQPTVELKIESTKRWRIVPRSEAGTSRGT